MYHFLTKAVPSLTFLLGFKVAKGVRVNVKRKWRRLKWDHFASKWTVIVKTRSVGDLFKRFKKPIKRARFWKHSTMISTTTDRLNGMNSSYFMALHCILKFLAAYFSVETNIGQEFFIKSIALPITLLFTPLKSKFVHYSSQNDTEKLLG